MRAVLTVDCTSVCRLYRQSVCTQIHGDVPDCRTPTSKRASERVPGERSKGPNALSAPTLIYCRPVVGENLDAGEWSPLSVGLSWRPLLNFDDVMYKSKCRLRRAASSLKSQRVIKESIRVTTTLGLK